MFDSLKPCKFWEEETEAERADYWCVESHHSMCAACTGSDLCSFSSEEYMEGEKEEASPERTGIICRAFLGGS